MKCYSNTIFMSLYNRYFWLGAVLTHYLDLNFSTHSIRAPLPASATHCKFTGHSRFWSELAPTIRSAVHSESWYARDQESQGKGQETASHKWTRKTGTCYDKTGEVHISSAHSDNNQQLHEASNETWTKTSTWCQYIYTVAVQRQRCSIHTGALHVQNRIQNELIL